MTAYGYIPCYHPHLVTPTLTFPFIFFVCFFLLLLSTYLPLPPLPPLTPILLPLDQELILGHFPVLDRASARTPQVHPARGGHSSSTTGDPFAGLCYRDRGSRKSWCLSSLFRGGLFARSRRPGSALHYIWSPDLERESHLCFQGFLVILAVRCKQN